MASVAVDVSRVLRQCGQYVRWGNSARAFHHIDNYAHERLAILSSRNTASGAATGDATIGSGSSVSGSTASPERCGTGHLRMPRGERCRKAVYGRTACTV